MKDGTLEKIKEVKTLIAGGMKLKDALKQTHTSHNSWYAYKDKRGPNKKPKQVAIAEPHVVEVPITAMHQNRKVVAIVGDPKAVMSFIGEFINDKE